MPANGQYTQADLVLAEPRLGWPKGYLTARAARAWAAIKAWFLVTYGMTITFNEGYRPLATQVYYWNLYQSGQGNPAAYPGNSKHGDAEAMDLDWPFTSWSTTAQGNWRANEARFGWSSSQGVADDEPWHKVNIGETTVSAVTATPIQNTTTTEDEDMTQITAMRNWDGSIGIVDDAGLLTVLTQLGEWQSYLRLGIVKMYPDGHGGTTPYLQQGDGTVWNALARVTARVNAQRAGDPAAIAKATTALLVPAVIAGLKEQGVVLTQQQVEDAAKAVIADALGAK